MKRNGTRNSLRRQFVSWTHLPRAISEHTKSWKRNRHLRDFWNNVSQWTVEEGLALWFTKHPNRTTRSLNASCYLDGGDNTLIQALLCHLPIIDCVANRLPLLLLFRLFDDRTREHSIQNSYNTKSTFSIRVEIYKQRQLVLEKH